MMLMLPSSDSTQMSK